MTLLLAIQVMIFTVGTAGVAFAGTGNLFLDGIEATDVHGVPFSNYGTLPLDRGDQWTLHKTFWASLTDLSWSCYVAGLGIVLRVFTWILSFEWLGFVLDPVLTVIESVQSIFAGFEWVGFALVIAAAVSGIAIQTGRAAAGWMDLLVSVLCSALAVGVLLSPVENMRGEDGAVATMQQFGDEFAQGMVADTNPDAEDLSISEVLSSQIVTILVRIPAQEVTFGGVLEGECADKYTQAMTETPPRSGDNSVRDAVSDCDEDAKKYVENPSAWQPITTFIIGWGSVGMMILIASITVLLFGAVLWAMWAGIRLMIFIYVAILPGTGRSALGHAALSMSAGLLAIAVVLMLSVGGLSVVLDMLNDISSSDADLPMVVILALMTMSAVFVALLLWYVVIKMRKKSRQLGTKLGGVGLGTEKPVRNLNIARRALHMVPQVAAASSISSAAKRVADGGSEDSAGGRAQPQKSAPMGAQNGPRVAASSASGSSSIEAPSKAPRGITQGNGGQPSSSKSETSKPSPSLRSAAPDASTVTDKEGGAIMAPAADRSAVSGNSQRSTVVRQGNVLRMQRNKQGVWSATPQRSSGASPSAERVIAVNSAGEGEARRRSATVEPLQNRMGRVETGLRGSSTGSRSPQSSELRKRLAASITTMKR